jgi:hypothetical protein
MAEVTPVGITPSGAVVAEDVRDLPALDGTREPVYSACSVPRRARRAL